MAGWNEKCKYLPARIKEIPIWLQEDSPKEYVKPVKISTDRGEWVQIRKNNSNMEHLHFGIHQNQEKNVIFGDYDAQKVFDGSARSMVLENYSCRNTDWL